MGILFETERMVVQRFTDADADYFYRVNGDPDVMRFIRAPKTREASDAFLQENIHLYKDGSTLGRFAVFHKTDHRFLGSFSFLYLSGEHDFHLGYALLPEEWGKGFATELVMAGIAHFFRHTACEAVFAITETENTASRKVLEKNGFRLSGHLPEQGKMLDVFKYSKSQTAVIS
ncbi:MAG: GNAT family N-acetyltransferase [Bacteroidota bacterium]|nr:GNAT family N-acetyltransferase [Bacteroidota bacterium]